MAEKVFPQKQSKSQSYRGRCLKVRWVSVMAHNGSLSQSSTHHLHKTHMKTRMAKSSGQIQKQVENEIKNITIIIFIITIIIITYHLCDHLYTHIVIINMKSYVKMEMFSLSSLPSLHLSLSLCIYPGRLEERVYGGLREKNRICPLPVICLCILCATISAFLCK